MRKNPTASLLLLLATLAPTMARSSYAQGSAAKAKNPLHGLVTMGALGPLTKKGGHGDNTLKEANVHPGVYSAVAILASWDELEHVEGKLDSSAIDAGLDAIRTYNKEYPATPIVGKLRIFSGPNTPDWVIAKSGGGVPLKDKRGAIDIGRFWTTTYRNSWKNLQTMLAARYDNDPLMGEVAVSSCATVTAEPFIQILTAENLPNMHAAGFSDAGFKACLLGAIDDYAAWKRTPLDYTVNPFRESDSGKALPAPDFTNIVLEAWRKNLGGRGVIANHGLQSPLAERALTVYAEIKKLGPPIEFQTVSPVVDWDASFAVGLAYKATEIELWNTKDAGGPANISMEQLKKWSAQMKATAPK